MSNDGKRPPVWKMIREATQALGGTTTNVAVRDWILERNPSKNKGSIQCDIIKCTVNHNSRIHYPGNHKPRRCTGSYDFLYQPERGKLEWYDPARHGQWEIAERDDGSLIVREADELGGTVEAVAPVVSEKPTGHTFAAETHLRDYLVQHLNDIEEGLELYVDDNGVDGVEFITNIGRIDILAVDRESRFVVIELKVAHGPDAVCGQLMRYLGWVKRHLAKNQPVRGIIIAQRISDRLRYALADVQNVQLKEYELSLKLRNAEPLE